MRSYDKQRVNNQRQKRVLSQHTIMPKSEMKEPVKNIPVVISSKLTIWTDCPTKIELIKQKYAGK